jgi:hypothetical protein
MERGGGDLEAEPDQHHRHCEDCERGCTRCVQAGGDRADAGRPGCPKAERDAVEEERRGKAAEQEVFERRFGRGRLAFAEAREDVGRDGRNFETDKDHQQLDRARHEHHAGRAETDQRKVFAGMSHARSLVEVVERCQENDRDHGRDQQVKEDAEAIDLHGVIECREHARAGDNHVVLIDRCGHRTECSEDGEKAERLARFSGSEHGLGHHHDHAGDGEYDFRQQCEKVEGH